MQIPLMYLYADLYFTMVCYDRQIFVEMKTGVYTVTYKAFFHIAPIDPFFHEYCLAVILSNIGFFFQINCLFPALR